MSSELNEKLHKILPSLRNAITVVTELHPEMMHVFALVDEIWQIRAGISLLSDDKAINDNAPQQETSSSFVSPEDAAIFAEINELWSPYHEITIEGDKVSDGKGSLERIWHVSIPCLNYIGGVATSPRELLQCLKTAIEVYINHEKQELLQDPIVHEAYVLQAQHNEAVDEHNKDVLARNGMPYELHFKVDIEFHDDLRWLIGTSVTEGGRWASTPDELLKAVKDNIEYLDTHGDEIKQLLGG